jgi:hypothetical protein
MFVRETSYDLCSLLKPHGHLLSFICANQQGERALGLAKGGGVRSPVFRLAVFYRSRWTGATNFEQADASRLMQTAEV